MSIDFSGATNKNGKLLAVLMGVGADLKPYSIGHALADGETITATSFIYCALQFLLRAAHKHGSFGRTRLLMSDSAPSMKSTHTRLSTQQSEVSFSGVKRTCVVSLLFVAAKSFNVTNSFTYLLAVVSCDEFFCLLWQK